MPASRSLNAWASRWRCLLSIPSTITMAAPQRRVPPNQQYYAVPQSPQATSRFQSQAPSQPMPPPQPSTSQAGRSDTTYGVATGTIGGGYGPYSVRSVSVLFIVMQAVLTVDSTTPPPPPITVTMARRDSALLYPRHLWERPVRRRSTLQRP